MLRQVALIRNHVFLQQFASGENPEFMHSHPWTYGTLAIGLWGSLVERRQADPTRHKVWKAPYARYMGPNYVHQSVEPGDGHTSIFIGLGRKTDEKYYFKSDDRIHWRQHILKIVRPEGFK